MATVYQWSGKTVRGLVETGEITASSKEEVIAQLRRRNITATVVNEKPAKTRRIAFGGGGVGDKDIVVFTRQFATMIDAGLPLVQALDILSSQVENKALGKTLAQVKTDVESGATYADALKKHPKIFSELYVNMVAAGEAGGILDTILNRLSAYIEKAMKLKKRVKGAMVYPAVVTSIAVLVIAVIMIFVVPTFSKMFTTLGGTLPMPRSTPATTKAPFPSSAPNRTVMRSTAPAMLPGDAAMAYTPSPAASSGASPSSRRVL